MADSTSDTVVRASSPAPAPAPADAPWRRMRPVARCCCTSASSSAPSTQQLVPASRRAIPAPHTTTAWNRGYAAWIMSARARVAGHAHARVDAVEQQHAAALQRGVCGVGVGVQPPDLVGPVRNGAAAAAELPVREERAADRAHILHRHVLLRVRRAKVRGDVGAALVLQAEEDGEQRRGDVEDEERAGHTPPVLVLDLARQAVDGGLELQAAVRRAAEDVALVLDEEEVEPAVSAPHLCDLGADAVDGVLAAVHHEHSVLGDAPLQLLQVLRRRTGIAAGLRDRHASRPQIVRERGKIG